MFLNKQEIYNLAQVVLLNLFPRILSDMSVPRIKKGSHHPFDTAL